ncbi:MAG TPA: transketolase C-terminal domain-containing protein [Thermoplasmata archaeon]|nr:transketolase C-terminal domain-containing protein [Thermoplasmata archaeon]
MPRAVLSGNSAQSYAAKLARVQVISAYPITPQTTVVEKLADFVASGELPAQFVKVESEHSAMQVCISAASLGARVYTATSSQGLLLMHELLHWASGARVPVVMGVVNRAIAPPLSIWTDHADSIAQRDTGWIQFYVESNQEALDTTLLAFRLAEHPDVRLPAMVAGDGFYLSHTVEPVDLPTQEDVDAFLPSKPPPTGLRLGVASRMGSYTGPELYMEFRHKVARAMDRASAVLPEVEDDYERIVGRHHGGPLPLYRVDDADAVLVTMGTATTTARAVVDTLRDRGRKVGLAKLRVFRPFPVRAMRALAADVDRIGVLDRSFTFGAMGAAHAEVAASLYGGRERPLLRGFVAGLGGRDITPATIESMFGSLSKGEGSETEWVGLKRREEVVRIG